MRRLGLTDRVGAAVAAGTVAAAAVFAALAGTIQDLHVDTSERKRSLQLVIASDRAQAAVVDLESSLRALMVTGPDGALSAWASARRRAAAGVGALRRLAAPSGATAELVRAVDAATAAYLGEHAHPLVDDVRRTGRVPVRQIREHIAAGDARLRAIRRGFDRIKRAELAAAERHDRDASAAGERALRFGAGGLMLVVALGLSGVAYLRRSVTAPVDAVAAAAARLADGGGETGVLPSRPRAAREIELLMRSFERMDATLREQRAQLQRQNASLGRRVRERTEDLERARREALMMLALAAEYRDDDTHRHTQRVGRNAAVVGAALGLSADAVELLRDAAPLHDVGKIGISDTIILKPGRLTAPERATMKEHALIGASILGSSQAPLFHVAAEIAATHHERWDGSGYPDGLAGDEIPLAGRIVALVDVFDALTHARPYKEAWPVDRAVEEIHRSSGSHFDPAVVAAFDSLDPKALTDAGAAPALMPRRALAR